MPNKTRIPVAFLIPLFLLLMISVPAAIAVTPFVLAVGSLQKILALAFAPAIFLVSFVSISTMLSTPFQKAIIPGKFPRDISHIVYGPRRLYALCWCAVFYTSPVYYALMSVKSLKKAFMWGFGYRGAPNVEIAPDAWLRDLPLLKFGEGVYTANKCTIGTNICLADGHILVDSIALGAKTMIGHMTMIAPGCKFSDHIEVGVGSGIGIRVKVGDKTRIGPTTTVNHGAVIGANVDIGTMSYIGLKCKIGDNVSIPSGTVISEGSEINSPEDVQVVVAKEKDAQHDKRTELAELFTARTALRTSG
jgi:acetyltransferase-like isoleucine patch superfamily enzyme